MKSRAMAAPVVSGQGALAALMLRPALTQRRGLGESKSPAPKRGAPCRANVPAGASLRLWKRFRVCRGRSRAWAGGIAIAGLPCIMARELGRLATLAAAPVARQTGEGCPMSAYRIR